MEDHFIISMVQLAIFTQCKSILPGHFHFKDQIYVNTLSLNSSDQAKKLIWHDLQLACQSTSTTIDNPRKKISLS
jgi:hypothetical protein